MTTHPDELLAEYAEGSLGPDERARVDAHISGCARCSEDVALAGEARRSLASLPDLAVPEGLGFAARSQARRGSPRPRVLKAVAGVAAVAVLIGGLTFAAMSGGDGGRDASTGGGGDEATEAPDDRDQAERESAPALSADAILAYPQLRSSDQRYDAAALPRAGRRLRREALAALEQGLPPTAAAFYEGFDVTTLPRPTARALTCVTDAFTPDRSVVPFVIEEASFDEEPAYLASFLQGPAPDEPYDRIVMIAAGTSDCALRTLASQRL